MSTYDPHIGNNLEGDIPQVEFNDDSYADLESLRRDLSLLSNYLDRFRDRVEEDLNNLAIQVDHNDMRMTEAHQSLWASEGFGEVPETISYRYYKILRLSNRAAAEYVRKSFEDAVRDATGSNALDILMIADMTRQEILLIQDFLNSHIPGLTDSSERRIVELFQDWGQSAVKHIQSLAQYYDHGHEDGKLPREGLDAISRQEAKQGQAVFKVKMNTLNGQITKDLDYLKRNFSDMSETFYERFLGPAEDVRMGVSRFKLPNPSSAINDEVLLSEELLDDNLKNVITDQARRKDIYHNKLEELEINIRERDKYRTLVNQLGQKGKPLPASGPGIVVPASDTEEQLKQFQRLDLEPSTFILPAARDSGSRRGSHDFLEDLNKGNDHPQYLLRSGGQMTGDIVLGEGIHLDSIIPSEHAHTGEDGSKRVRGEDLIIGTLRTNLVDENFKPDTPIDLNIDEYDPDVIPPGLAVIDTNLSWEGFDEETFEVQIVRVGKKAESIEGQKGYLWVLAIDPDSSSWRIYQINAETGAINGSLASPTQTPGGLDFQSHFGEPVLWVVDQETNIIYKVNATDGTTIQTYQLPDTIGNAKGISFEGDHWLITDGATVYKVDIESLIITEQFG